MKLHEYQAKELLAAYGVPVPQHFVAASGDEARDAAAKLGGRGVVKAQVHAGGRGKAGGVKIANDPAEAAQIAESLIGSTLVTFQTGPQGAPVHKVLVEQTMDIERELYLSITTDGGRRRPVVIASASGGMEIEEVAQTEPEKVFTEPIDPAIGFQPYQGRRLAAQLELPASQTRPFSALVDACYRAYMEKDSSMIEINPLVLTGDGKLLALDAKISIDDDSLFRHSAEADLRDTTQDDPLEVQASEAGIAYVKLDGNVGCMVNGAGLAMATMDIVKFAGAEPANFLDVGGGAGEEKISYAILLMLSDQNVEKVLVNIFGGILRCDMMRPAAAGGGRGDEARRRVPRAVRDHGPARHLRGFLRAAKRLQPWSHHRYGGRSIMLECVDTAFSDRYLRFVDAGRIIHAYLAWGPEASHTTTRTKLWAILNGLRFTRRAVRMSGMPAEALGECRAAGRVRTACPHACREPASPSGQTSSARTPALAPPIAASAPGSTSSISSGGPRTRAIRETTGPPRLVHLAIYAGKLDAVFPETAAGGSRVGARGGLMLFGPRASHVQLGTRLWNGTAGSLTLAPPHPLGGQQGNHLIYRWQRGEVEYALGLHAWEPFTEAIATLRETVESIP